MSVSQRNNGWQAHVVVDGQRFRKTFSTKEEAATAEAMVRQAMVQGKPMPTFYTEGTNLTYTLRQAFDTTYDMYWRGSKSDEKVTLNIKQLEAYFGKNRPVTEVTTKEIDDFIVGQKRKNLSNATINRKLATLSKTLRLAHEQGKLKAMPVFHRQKEGQGRIRWVTKEEESLILQTMEQWNQHDLYDAMIVSIDTGLRRSELERLTSSDITKEGIYVGDFEHGTKNGTFRVVPLTTRAREVLTRRARDNRHMFKSFWNRDMWDRVRNHLNMDDVVWHTLRHTTCSRLVQGGMSLVKVKEWMGHKSIQTTMRYSHLTPKHLQEGVSLLEG
jgi:integrase